jgi:predicted HAD superfamily hydrolase
MNMPPISEELQTFIDHFKYLETFDDIATAAEDYCQFNINDSHTLHSAKQIIVDLLMAYKLKKIEKLSEDGCEKDVIHRLWRNSDLFYEDDFSVSRGDYMCLASSLRVNGDSQNE